jgi:VIT1/CCC1 family predicted Fe2+/Mn2+ transporter
MPGPEKHYITRAGWLRAAVLGANDGLISTASLIVGVASASGVRTEIVTAAFAGWAAGAMAMAAGEFVSVSSQADLEAADLERERKAIAEQPEVELEELTAIYEHRGVSHLVASEVATELMHENALAAHAHDELGLFETHAARPVQAAIASGLSFSAGALAPTIAAVLAPTSAVVPTTAAATLVLLAALGALGARLGGAAPLRPALRVTFWGALALAVTAGVGALIGRAV